MTFLKFTTFLFCFLFTVSINAQKVNFKNYSVANGLPQSDVVDALQDPIGYIWFATQGGGIARFDGEKFKVYNQNDGLISNFVNALFLKNDSLIIGTNNGLSIKNKAQITNYTTPKINAFFNENHKLYLATKEGIYLLRKGYVVPIKFNLKIDLNTIENISYYKSFYWIKTAKELWKVDQLYQPKNILIATQKEVEEYIESKRRNFDNLDIENSIKLITSKVFKDRQQNNWLLTSGNGVYKSLSTNFDHFNNSIKEVTLMAIANTVLWFTNTNQQLFASDSLGIQPILNLDFKATSITTDSNNNLWFGSENNGIYIYRRGMDSVKTSSFKIERLYSENGFPYNKIKAIHIQDNLVWVVTKNDGIVKLEYDFEHGFVKNSYRFNKNNGIKDLDISTSLLYNNQIWYATTNGAFGTISNNSVTHYSNFLKHNTPINSIAFNNNRLYLGTLGRGIWSVNSNYLNQIQPLNNSILSSQNVFQFVFDNNHHLWVGSEKGLDQLEMKNNTIVKATHYNENDGFIGIETSKNASIKDAKGNLWFGTKKGISKYTLAENNFANTTPTVHFENIEIAYQNIDRIKNQFNKHVLQLKPTQNHLSFTYKTVDINQPKRIEYQWKLNDEISSWSTSNSINFSNSSAGEYVFSVKSRNANKVESESISFHFKIDTPLHKKPWFVFSVFGSILFIVIIIIVFYYRRKQKDHTIKIEKLTLENHLISLEQKALQLQMNPHFIFNVLNGIKALGNSGNTVELNKTVSQFATLLRSILQNSRKEEISLTEEITTLKNYLELEQKISPNVFEYSIETNTKNIDTEEILIPPMLLQPFIENSIKHGFKGVSYIGSISIVFEIKNRFLHCSILDNGVGFKHSTSTKDHESIALKVTKERIENLSKYSTLGMSEQIENNIVIGTKVEFKIPLKTDY